MRSYQRTFYPEPTVLTWYFKEWKLGGFWNFRARKGHYCRSNYDLRCRCARAVHVFYKYEVWSDIDARLDRGVHFLYVYKYDALHQWFLDLSCKQPCPAHVVCLPCQTHPVQVLQSLLTSWWVESDVIRETYKNVQGRGDRFEIFSGEWIVNQISCITCNDACNLATRLNAPVNKINYACFQQHGLLKNGNYSRVLT